MGEKQKNAFLDGEGDSWFLRNARKLTESAQRDPLLRELKEAQLAPKTALEIGCSNGWRLEAMRETWTCAAFGVDPSAKAIAEGKGTFPLLDLRTGTADSLPFEDGQFDLVVLGFCLYLCDRDDLFRIAMEVDRVLADGGHLAILDFFSAIPYRNRYQHKEGVFCYKMSYATMFSWNPAFSTLRHTLLAHDGAAAPSRDDLIAVSILKKDTRHAYVENPYSR
jgi:SAM-dependent methyltransferase